MGENNGRKGGKRKEKVEEGNRERGRKRLEMI